MRKQRLNSANKPKLKLSVQFLAFSLIFSLSLPNLALALKPTETKEGAGLEELDETLRTLVSGNPNDFRVAGLQLTNAIELTPKEANASGLQVVPIRAAGMEEKLRPEDARVLIIGSDRAILGDVRQIVEDQLRVHFGTAISPRHQVHTLEIRGEVNQGMGCTPWFGQF